MKKIAVAVAVLLVVAMFAACGSSAGGKTPAADPAEKYYGTYKLAGLASDNDQFTQEVMDSTFETLGEDYIVLVWEKDNISMTANGATQDGFTIDVENGTISDGNETYDMEFGDDGTLVMHLANGDNAFAFILKKVE